MVGAMKLKVKKEVGRMVNCRRKNSARGFHIPYL
jgi:hypothetical protein